MTHVVMLPRVHWQLVLSALGESAALTNASLSPLELYVEMLVDCVT